MSNPDLYLSVASNFSIEDVQESLNIDLRDGDLACSNFKWARVAGIAIGYEVRAELPSYVQFHNWDYALRMKCSLYWTECRLAVALSLYEIMDFKQNGFCLAWEDTGDFIFYGRKGMLSLDLSVKDRVSRLLLLCEHEFVSLNMDYIRKTLTDTYPK